MRLWEEVALSADGQKLIASVYNGYLYTSANGGLDWEEQTSLESHIWENIAISPDGTKLAAITNDSFLQYTLYTYEDGGSWTKRKSDDYQWGIQQLIYSYDSKKLIYTHKFPGLIHISSDNGQSWKDYCIETAYELDFLQVAISFTGEIIAFKTSASSNIFLIE